MLFNLDVPMILLRDYHTLLLEAHQKKRNRDIRFNHRAAILFWRHRILSWKQGHVWNRSEGNHAEQRSLLHAQMPKQKKKIPGFTFHQFPKDEALRKQWIYQIRRDVGKNFKVSYWI